MSGQCPNVSTELSERTSIFLAAKGNISADRLLSSTLNAHPTTPPVTFYESLPRQQVHSASIMSDHGEVEVENTAAFQVLPKEALAEMGTVKLFNKWSYEDVEIRDISLT